jgi:hypothetical protein
MFALNRSIVKELQTVVVGLTHTSLTAAGTGDNTAAPGASIDVTSFAAGRAESVAFLIQASASLTASKTLVVTGKIETSDDGSTWTVAVASATLLTLSATGTNAGTAKVGVSLEYCKKYVRVNLTPDLNATGTDTATVSAVAVFFGQYRKLGA